MASSPTETVRHFAFAFDALYRLPARALGIHDATAWVEIDDDSFEARFGPWRVRTPLSNITGAKVTGPYSVPKTIGPAHLSFSDRGLTFATNPHRGVCVTFDRPVRGMDPLGLVRHPGLTVTVADAEGLIEALRDVGAAPSEIEEQRVEQAAEDQLHTMTAAELRALADERGVSHPSSLKKAELVELLEADLGEDLVEELAPEQP